MNRLFRATELSEVYRDKCACHSLCVVITRFSNAEQKEYAGAGAVAEEVLSSIRTVVSFGGEHKEAAR